MKKLGLFVVFIAFLVLLFVTLRLFNKDQSGFLYMKNAENAGHQQQQTIPNYPKVINSNHERKRNGRDLENTSTKQAFPDSAKSSNPDIEREKLIKIAYERAREVMEIPDSASAVITYGNDEVTVTFPYPKNEEVNDVRYPGPDYAARVRLNPKTGKVIEILGAP